MNTTINSKIAAIPCVTRHLLKAINFIILLLVSTTCFANDIDKLQTNEDVYQFLVKKVSKEFKNSPPLDDSPKSIDTAKYGRNKFFKVDIDNNGLTDLIIYGFRNFLVVMDNGKKEYPVHYLDRGAFLSNTATLISIDTSASPKKIVIQQSKRPKQKFDTLVFKYDSFIEYNPTPATAFVFHKIRFKTDQCFGECPVFEMIINKDRTAAYKAIMFNEETGDFSGTIPTKEFDELVSILEYLKLDRLNSDYAVNWTDDQTATTEVEFNGKKKVIRDYGKIGTFGLSILYSKLFSLRKTVEWRQ